MKKSLSVFVALVTVLLLIVLISASNIEQEIDSELSLLPTYGLSVETVNTKEELFFNEREFILSISNPKKFQRLLEQKLSKKLPSNLALELLGAQAKVSLRYSKLLVTSDIKASFMLTKLPLRLQERLSYNNLALLKQIEAFLEKEGLLFELTTDISLEEMSLQQKPINTTFNLRDEKLKLTLEGHVATYKAQTKDKYKFLQHIKNFSFTSQQEVLSFKDYEYFLDNEKPFSYKSNFNIATLHAQKQHMLFMAESIQTKTEANEKENGVDTKTDVIAKKPTLVTPIVNLNTDALELKLDAKALHKKALQQLQNLSQTHLVNNEELFNVLALFLEKGFVFNLEYLRAKNIFLENKKSLGDVVVSLNATMPALKNKAINNQISPALIQQNLDANANIELSSSLYAFLRNNIPALFVVELYKKEKANSVVFDLKFQKGQLSVNDAVLF